MLKNNTISEIYHKLRISWFIIAILALSIFLKLLWIFYVPNSPVSDFEAYFQIASSIREGLGARLYNFPVAFQGMGYPLLLGAVFKLFVSNSIIIGKIMNVILSSLTLIFFYKFLDCLDINKKIKYWSLIIVAFLPNYIAYCSVLGSEILFTFFLSVILYLLVSKIRIELQLSLLGVLIGLAALTKPFFIAYPIVIFFYYLLRGTSLRASFKKILIISCFSLLTIMPWSIRNYKNYHLLIPISYNSGYVLYINNNSDNTTGGWMRISKVQKSEIFEEQLSTIGYIDAENFENEASQVISHPVLESKLRKEAVRWATTHPINFLGLGLKRVYNVYFLGAIDIENWAMNGIQIKENSIMLIKNLFLSLSSLFVTILSLAAFIASFLSTKEIINAIKKQEKFIISQFDAVFLANFLFFTLVYFVFEGQPRYNFPLLLLFPSSLVFILLEKISVNKLSSEK